jgi:ATP-dependent RNA helicase RhlE
MSFSSFDLDPRCLDVLKTLGIEKPMPVQAQAIPIVAEGHDLIATAQTGTGKTLGFALPSLSRLSKGKQEKNMMLVLVPTRELAVQVQGVIRDFGKALKIHSTAIFGGVGMYPQIDALKRGCGVIVATPGRLLDHLQQGTVDFKNLKILVLDEADRMLDMGFLPDIKRILSKLPKERQTLMFSATFDDAITKLAKDMLNNPKRISIGMTTKPVDTVKQITYAIKQEDKSALLLSILKYEKPTSALIFTRTKHRADRVGRMLKGTEYSVAVIHGNRTQSQRQIALDGFKSGKYQILVATDVAARGIDVDHISHVINFDIPDEADAYIHRIGRTGRAQATGDAITFVAPEDRSLLRDIEKKIGKQLPKGTWEQPLEKAPQQQFREERPSRPSRFGSSRSGHSGESSERSSSRPARHGGPRSDRSSRPSRHGSSWSDRTSRSERPAFAERSSRSDRPSWSDRPSQSDRFEGSDRSPHSDRSSQWSNESSERRFNGHGAPGSKKKKARQHPNPYQSGQRNHSNSSNSEGGERRSGPSSRPGRGHGPSANSGRSHKPHRSGGKPHMMTKD